MFSTDPYFLLTLHRSHLDELLAEADSARLARLVRLASKRNAARSGSNRRPDPIGPPAPAVE